MTLTDPAGGTPYVSGQIFTANDATTIASQLPYALDGNAGGSYAPTAPLIVSGSGMTITTLNATGGGSLSGTFTGSPTLSGSVTLSGGGAISGDWSGAPIFTGTPRVTGTLTLSGSGAQITTLGTGGTPTFQGNWKGNPLFKGNPGFDSGLRLYAGCKMEVRSGAELEWQTGATFDCKSTANFTGNTNLNGTNSLGTATLNGAVTIGAVMTDTAGRHVRKTTTFTMSGNEEHSITEGSQWFVGGPGYDLTVDTDNAVAGDTLMICSTGTDTGTTTVVLKCQQAGQLFLVRGTGGCVLTFNGTRWHGAASHHVSTITA